MKKRIIAFLITAVICLCSAGCTKEPGTNSPTEEGTQLETREETRGETKTDETAQEPALPASARLTDVRGLYRFENGIEDFSHTINASVSDGILRMEFISPGLDTVEMKIVTYSLSEDRKLGEITLPEGSYSTGDLDDGGFYTVSLTSTEVSFYDRNCNKTYNKTIYESDFIWNYTAVSGDGKHLLYNRAIDGSIVLYTFSIGTEEVIGDKKGTFISIGCKDGYFYLRDYESGIYRISTEQKKLETVTEYDISGLATMDYIIGETHSYFVMTSLQDTGNRKMTPMKNKNEIPAAANDSYFATVANEQRGSFLRIYNIKDSSVSPEILIPGFIQNVLFCDKDMVMIISHDSEAERTLYHLYDLTDSVEFESIIISEADDKLLNYESIPEWTGDSETIAFAEGILEEYGVRIIYGTTDIDSESYYYTSQPVDDTNVLPIMQRVEDVLKFFPEGMTQEIGQGEELWIYLCEDIVHMDNGNSVGGFASVLGKHSIIFMDAEYNEEIFKETLVHELSHVIDYCMDPELKNGWINLMPEDIAGSAYVNSYNTKTDNSYTPYDNGNTEVWFYDSYSKTFPTEDRAVIFQKMYLSHKNGKMTFEFENYENLRKKAVYYCEMLRETFDSCKNADTLSWEDLFIDR